MESKHGDNLAGSALPAALGRLMEGRGRPLLAQESDLSGMDRFGQSFVILTDSHILAIRDGALVVDLPLSRVREVKLEELVGGGRVVAVLKGDGEGAEAEAQGPGAGALHLAYYTNHRVPHFAALARFASERLRGRMPALPEESRPALCPRCGRPLPERDTVCPLCVPKWRILLRILGLTRPYRGQVIGLLGCAAAGVAFQVAPPYLTKLIVDEVVGKGRADRLWWYVGGMLACGALFLGARLIHVALTAKVSARVVADLRERLHARLQYLRMDFFSRREPGEVVGRVMHDTGELQQFLVEGMPFLTVNTLSLLAIGAILLKLDWALALLVFLPVPAFVFGSRWFWDRLHPLFHRQGAAVGHMHSTLNESIQGLKVVKAFGQEEARGTRFGRVNADLRDASLRIQRTFGSFNEGMSWIMGVGVAMVWFFGVRRITGAGKGLTLGALLAFVGYIWQFYGPLQWFSVVLNWMSHAFSGAERIFEVLDSRTEREEHPQAADLPRIRGAIEFRDVHFSYERGKEALRGVTFSIAPGEVVGLVGKSGAGKSTIINLLSRFFEPDSGEIRVDGAPVDRIRLACLRGAMGIVLQEPFLFNASIAENIAFGLPGATFRDVVEAAKAAHAHEFILAKPNGYDTTVGEHGIKLSGGEKQRLSIARALLHDPPILILDEATSSVDASTEKKIQEAINRLIRGRTTLAIAHRLSTLRNADRLLVVDQGRIAEAGTHEELMARKGIYHELAQAYQEMSALRQVVWGG